MGRHIIRTGVYVAGAAMVATIGLWPAHALAAGAGSGIGGSAEALMLAQVALLVIGGRFLGEVMSRIGQPTIIGQILVGVLLGPTVLGALWPQAEHFLFPPTPEQNAMITGLSQLGILFLLLLAGMETDLALAYRLRRQALSVSLAGIAVPFACGFLLGMLMPESILPDGGKRIVMALFLGTALSISSLKIVATVVREMNFMRRNIGQLIVAAAVIDDTAGWVIIAITLGIATHGKIDVLPLTGTVVGTLAFLGLSFTVGRRAVFEIIRWTNDSLHSDMPVTTAIVALMLVLALITAGLGVQTVLGAFVAGLLIGQSPILTRQIDEQVRGLTTALFMPVFFGLTGLHADLRVLADPATLGLTVDLVLIASIGTFGDAFLGAKVNGMSRQEALALGFGMNARGSTEVIVASIGLSVGVLDQRLFSVIVTMAVITTLLMPPTLRWALARLPIKDEEKQRLEREEFEEESVISRLERILLVVDESPAGRLASQLAGRIGGLRNMPVTALNLAPSVEPVPDRPAAEGETVEPATSDTIERVRDSSNQTISRTQQPDALRDPSIHIGTRIEASDLTARVGVEAQKGHDFLITGIEPLTAPSGGFDGRADALLGAFKQTSAIVLARGGLKRRPYVRLRLLVPVSGDVRSMRALEVAVLLAKASDGQVTALHVQPARSRRAGDSENGPSAESILAHAQGLGRHFEVEVKTVLERGRSPGLSILGEAKRGRHNLIVLGVSRRAGEGLSFGPVPDTLLETSDRSVLFLASS